MRRQRTTEPRLTDQRLDDLTVAVLIPCRNEQASVAQVVTDFRAALPTAEIYVYDNCSTDLTARVAAAAGAVVRREHRPGKGNVIQRMFNDIDADVYVMVDGDDTYHAADAPAMIAKLLDEQLDMVTALRYRAIEGEVPERRGHALGNLIFTRLVGRMFGTITRDVLSGYRVLSRRFVKSFPARTTGFDIEIEMTAHAADVWAPCGDVRSVYRNRAEGSASKLRTYRDGWRLLRRSVRLMKEIRPLAFYGVIAIALSATAFLLSVPVVSEYAATGLVLRYPTWILAIGIQTTGFLSLVCGLLTDSMCNARREAKRLAYLAQPGLAAGAGAFAAHGEPGATEPDVREFLIRPGVVA